MSGVTYMVECAYCGKPVDAFANTTYHRVVGWERKVRTRASGKQGGSDITLRERRDEHACPRCIDKLKHNIDPGQGTLA